MRAKLGAYYFFLTIAIASAATMMLDDKEIAKRLIGTWSTDPSDLGPITATVTYKANGTGTQVIRPRGEPETASVRVTTRWSITNAVLHMTSTASSDPQRIPVGINLKDRIISISADKFECEPLDGYGETNGKRETRIRKKAP